MVVEGIISTFDKSLNFWEVHPNFKLISAFKKFYNRDRSINNQRSSQEMWAFAFMYDMGESNFLRNLPREKRMETIAKDILEKPSYDWDKEKEVQQVMRELCQPPPQVALQDLYAKLQERTAFINKTPYSLDHLEPDPKNPGKKRLVKGTATQLDAMMKGTKDIFEQIEMWQKKIAMERDSRKERNLSDSMTGEM